MVFKKMIRLDLGPTVEESRKVERESLFVLTATTHPITVFLKAHLHPMVI